MTAIRGVFGAVDEAAAAYRNQAEDVRAAIFHALGGTEGVLEGFDMTPVSGSMFVELAAGRALIAERGVDITAEDRGYYVFADDVTTVPFEAASVADRCDAVVFAWPDPQYGTIGAGVSAAGPQIVVVKGVSGSTTPRTDAEINTAIGVGGWFRYADVVVESTDTEIQPGNITTTYPDANNRVGHAVTKIQAADQSVAAVATYSTDMQGFGLVAGASYYVTVCALGRTAVAGTDMRVQIQADVSVDITNLGVGPATTVDGVSGDANHQGDYTAGTFLGLQYTFGIPSAGTDDASILLHCLVKASSTDGLLGFKFLSGTGGVDVTLRQGSFMRVERVA